MAGGVSNESIQIPIFLQPGPLLDGVKAAMGGLGKLAGKITKTGAAVAAFGAIIGFLAFQQMKKAIAETIRFQGEMVGLQKILGAEASFPIGEQLANLSTRMPLARVELINIAETAARLGIRGVGNIVMFTEAMAKMGVSTNISAEVAADAMARIAKQTGLPVAKIENLGSVMNELSNTMATSTSEIVAAVRRSAPELARLGMPAETIAAFAATLNTVSESATRAGTRLRRFAQAVTDPDKVEIFAEALEMSVTAFRRLREEDPTAMFMRIIKTFKENSVAAEKMGSGLDARVRLALAAYAQVYGDLSTAVALSSREMKENTSLNLETDRVLGIVTSKLVIHKNNIIETRREIGEKLLPMYTKWLDMLLSISRGIADIVDRPLEGLISEDSLADLETAVLRLQDIDSLTARGSGAQRSLMGGYGGLTEQDFGTKVDPADARRFLREIEAITLALPRFGRQFAEIAAEIVINNAEAEQSFTVTRTAVLGLAQGINALAGVEDEAGERSKRIAQRLNEMNVEFIQGSVLGLSIAGAVNSYAASLGAVNIVLERNAELLGETAMLIPSAETQDFIAGLKNEAWELTATNEELLRATDAWKELEERIKTAEATGRGNTEELVSAQAELRRYYFELIDAEVAAEALADSQAELERTARETAAAQKQLADRVESLKNSLIAESAEILFGEEASYRFKLAQDGIHGSIQDNIVGLWKFTEMLKKWNEQAGGSDESAEAIRKRIERREDLFDLSTVESRFRLLERVVNSLADTTMEFFEALVSGSGRAGEALTNMIKSVAEELIRSQVLKFFMGVLGAGGQDIFGIKKGLANAGSKGNPINMFEWMGGPASFFAKGGSVSAGQLAVVGEKGPELFVPNVGGKVIPNNKLSSSGGGEVVVLNNHFTIQALDGSSVREVLAKEQDFLTGLSIDKIQRHRALKR